MKIIFPSASSDQKKYLSGLSAISCVAWSTPIYNFLISYFSHEISFSLDKLSFLSYCGTFSLSTLWYGYNILGEKNDKWFKLDSGFYVQLNDIIFIGFYTVNSYRRKKAKRKERYEVISGRQDLNLWPSAPETDALPSWATTRRLRKAKY